MTKEQNLPNPLTPDDLRVAAKEFKNDLSTMSAAEAHQGLDGLQQSDVYKDDAPELKAVAETSYKLARTMVENATLKADAEPNRLAARTDRLTRLKNRLGLEEALDDVVSQSKPFITLLVDLDRFKQINDQHGHTHGDLVLKKTAHALESSVRSKDVVARLGGDEFVVVFNPDGRLDEEEEKAIKAEPITREDYEKIAGIRVGKLSHNIARIRETGSNGPTEVEASVGYGVWMPGDPSDFDSLIKPADDHMYTVKQARQELSNI